MLKGFLPEIGVSSEFRDMIASGGESGKFAADSIKKAALMFFLPVNLKFAGAYIKKPDGCSALSGSDSVEMRARSG